MPALVGLMVAAAGATRLAYLLSDRVAFNGDEAVTAIMARDILHGQLYAFYAGQHYGGALEQYLQAGLYFVLRLPQNPVTLRLVQVALSMATCWLVYRCARIMLDSPAKALVAAGLYAIGPWFNVLLGATSLGFYSAGVTLGTAALYCALRIRDGTRWQLAFGLCCGLALWTSLTSAYLIVPALVWVAPQMLQSLGRRRSLGRRHPPGRRPLLGPVLLGFATGSAPVWYLVIIRHELPLPHAAVVGPSLADRFRGVVGPLLREFLGISYWGDRGGAPRVVQALVVAGLVIAYVAAVWRHRGSLRATLTFRAGGRQPIDLLLIAPIIVAALYMTSPNSVYTSTPRYLFSAYPLLVIGVAGVLPRRRPAAFAAAAGALGIATAVLCTAYFVNLRFTPTVAARDAMLRRVITTLSDRGERAVYADYWTAMPLQYLAGDRLDASPCSGTRRFARIDRRVAAAPDPAYVGNQDDRTAARISATLRAHGITYRTTRVGRFEIFDQLRRTNEQAIPRRCSGS